MSAEDVAANENASTTRAKAPVSGISVPAHLGVGTDLVDGLDYVVLLQVMFDTASGFEVTPLITWQRLQERGIRSTKNRNELVGKNSVYESYSRIIEAGYIERYRGPNEKHPGRMGPVAYRVYDNPAWNPVWQACQAGTDPLRATAASENPQVRTLPGTRDSSKLNESSNSKIAGQNTSRKQGSGVPGSGVPGRGGSPIPAGQNASPVQGRVGALPPHPPVEVTTSTPYPLSDGARSHPSQTEGEGGTVFDPKDVFAAESFLQRLPRKFALGPASAKKNALPLLRTMSSQGWPSIHQVDRALLTQELTKDSDDLRRPASIVPNRIRDLLLFEVVAPRPAQDVPRRRFIGSGL